MRVIHFNHGRDFSQKAPDSTRSFFIAAPSSTLFFSIWHLIGLSSIGAAYVIIFPLCWVIIQHSIRACISRRRHGSQGERSGSSRTGNHLQYVRMRTGCKAKANRATPNLPHPENTRIRTRVCLPTSTRKSDSNDATYTLDEVSTDEGHAIYRAQRRVHSSPRRLLLPRTR